MKKITTLDTFGNSRTYEVVEKIPPCFFVWNIGKNMGSEEYIPLAQWLNPGDKDDYRINPNTVKAIRLDKESVKILDKAASYGVNCLREAEKALKSKRKGPSADRKRKLAEMSIEIFKKITL